MSIRFRTVFSIAATILAALSAAASSAAPTTTTIRAAAVNGAPIYQHQGRVLASNCFQCHGTNGVGGPFGTIAGESSAEMFNELKELQTTTEGEEAIMRIHALGYDDAQLRQISDFFAKVPVQGGN